LNINRRRESEKGEGEGKNDQKEGIYRTEGKGLKAEGVRKGQEGQMWRGRRRKNQKGAR
jgi:hypothetical protein